MDDRRSQTSSKINMQFGTGKTSAGHKEYLKNMLINRMMKRFPVADTATRQTVESEVNLFIASEYVTKESMKQLEQRVARKLNPNNMSAQQSERNQREDYHSVHLKTEVNKGIHLTPKNSKQLNNIEHSPGPHGYPGPINRYQTSHARSVKRNISSKIKLVRGGGAPGELISVP